MDRVPTSMHTVPDIMPLLQTELLDVFEEAKQGAVGEEQGALQGEQIRRVPDPDSIGIKQTTFTWTNDGEAQTPVTPSIAGRRKFMLNIDGELLFKRGQMNLVVGPTGSGKTSLLMALLGK